MTDTDVQNEQQEEQRPRASLQKRLGKILSSDDHVASVDELKQLIEENEKAAAELAVAVQAHKAAALSLDCVDIVAEKHAEQAAILEHNRLRMVKPRLEERLAAAMRRENRDRWMADFLRVEEKVEAAAQRFSEYPRIAASLIEIFELAKSVDQEVDRINSNAMGSERLLHVELAARGLDRHDRENPSLAEVVTLFDFKQSNKQVWPPPRQSIGLLLAGVPSPDVRYSDRWFEAQGDRRAEQEAEAARTAAYYEQQEWAKEEREAAEERRAAAERQRSGIT